MSLLSLSDPSAHSHKLSTVIADNNHVEAQMSRLIPEIVQAPKSQVYGEKIK